jgi:hypothetical protein
MMMMMELETRNGRCCLAVPVFPRTTKTANGEGCFRRQAHNNNGPFRVEGNQHDREARRVELSRQKDERRDGLRLPVSLLRSSLFQSVEGSSRVYDDMFIEKVIRVPTVFKSIVPVESFEGAL